VAAAVARSKKAVAAVAEQPAAEPTAPSRPLIPENIAVVVIAYNRPQYLDRALTSIFAHHPGGAQFPVYVSQDGPNEKVAEVTRRHGAQQLVHPRHELTFQAGTYIKKFPGYAYLSVHYGWALKTLFGMGSSAAGSAQKPGLGKHGPPFEGVVILEEDIEVSADFFEYFTATAPLLYQDPTLLCVSAFNDNGQREYAGDPKALHRSDFFPGLGWLLTRRLWAELEGKWPDEKGFWDDWLREPPQRSRRASIRPEVSRTFTFGKAGGASGGQFYSKYLGKIALSAATVSWGRVDLSYLLRDNYEARFQKWLAEATPVGIERAMQRPAAGETGDIRVAYRDHKALVALCKRLGLMEDLKAGVPRTAYHGVVLITIHGRRVFLAPSFHVEQEITST
jgi:alpha-1,3-mannosyl-glycoprotein beta-1,2-N-acetylglucosaminyltransferase